MKGEKKTGNANERKVFVSKAQEVPLGRSHHGGAGHLVQQRKTVDVPDFGCLFLMGAWFLICGLWKLANNLGLFHSVRYGSKRFFQVILEHTAFADKLPKTGDYLSYLRAFVPDDTYPALLIIGGGLLLASLVFSLF